MLKTLQGENLQLLSQDLGPVSALRVDLLLVQIESCFRLCAICGSCSTNSLLIFLSARWGSDVSMCSPACMCVCVYYMFCAFWILLGVWFNQATPLTLARTQPPTQSSTHSSCGPRLGLAHIPWLFNQFDCYYLWLNSLKPEPIKRLSGVLTNPQDTPPSSPFFLLPNALVIVTISHCTPLVRWLSSSPVAH